MRTIGELGATTPILLSPDAITPVATYRLPEGASQGPVGWYLLRLHFRIDFAKDSGPGLAYVTASTNGRAAAQIRFRLAPQDGGMLVLWDTVDLLYGSRDLTTASSSVEVIFGNYLQVAGVQSGENTLTVGVEADEGVRVERLAVLDNTGIEYTWRSPPKLALDVSVPTRPVRQGETVRLSFRLTNSGGYPAQDVSVKAVARTGAVQVLEQDALRFAAVMRAADGAFTLRGERPGPFELVVAVGSGSGGRPAAVIKGQIEA